MAQNPDGATFRIASIEDSFEAYKIFRASLADLLQRMGISPTEGSDDEAVLARDFESRRSLYEHLARTSSAFYLAEHEGRPVGYARAIERDGVRQLTEFFVRPGQQASGVGRGLLARAFPAGGARLRTIIATNDPPAQALYLKSGVYPRFHLSHYSRQPQRTSFSSELEITPLDSPSAETLKILGEIDLAILDHRRDADHNWLLNDRQGYLYFRDGRPVGYGYVGHRSGPFALLEADDYPAVLAHAENEALAAGMKEFGLEVPMVNQTVIDTLLGRGYRFDSFIAFVMTDKPFGRFENYINSAPPYIL